jgi:rod shape-determining protein MreD
MKLWKKAVLLLSFLILDIYFSRYLKIIDFTPSFSLLFVTMVGISEGRFAGFVSGFITGLLFDAFSLSYFGLSAFIFSLVGIGIGFARKFITQHHPLIYAFFFVFPAVFFSNLLHFLFLYLFGEMYPFTPFLINSLGRALYTSIWAIVAFVFLLRKEILPEEMEGESGI